MGCFWDNEIDIFLVGVYFTAASQSEGILENPCKLILNSTWNLVINRGPMATFTLHEKAALSIVFISKYTYKIMQKIRLQVQSTP